MLTTADKEEVRRLVGEMLTELGTLTLHDGSAEEGPRTEGTEPIAEATARAMEVFGIREKALSWLKTPLPSLDDQTPLAVANQPDGLARVLDLLGQIEHGVW